MTEFEVHLYAQYVPERPPTALVLFSTSETKVKANTILSQVSSCKLQPVAKLLLDQKTCPPTPFDILKASSTFSRLFSHFSELSVVVLEASSPTEDQTTHDI